MRRDSATPAFLVGLALASAPAVAAGGTGGHTPASPPARATLEKTTEGRVTELASRLHLKLRTDDGRTVTFRLDETDVESKVAPDVAAGLRARVVENRLPDGKRSISVTVVPAPAGRR